MIHISLVTLTPNPLCRLSHIFLSLVNYKIDLYVSLASTSDPFLSQRICSDHTLLHVQSSSAANVFRLDSLRSPKST